MRVTVVVAMLVMAMLVSLGCPGPVHAQHFYLSASPDGCEAPFPFTEKVRFYLNAPDVETVGGIFRVDTDVFGFEDVVSLVAVNGVTIVSGDLFSGITLSWPATIAKDLELLQLELVDNRPFAGQNAVISFLRDTRLKESGGIVRALGDAFSWVNVDVACYGPAFFFPNDDTLDVVTGETQTVTLRYAMPASYPVSVSLSFSDARGWTGVHTPASFREQKCIVCDWDWRTISLTVTVPAGVAEETIDRVVMRIEGSELDHSREIYLRTRSRPARQESTIGGLKHRYSNSD